MTEKHIKLLGFKVEDKVTGFKGVVTSMTFDLYGCIQAIVQPYAKEGRSLEDSRYFDITRLKVKSKKPVMALPDFDLGYIAEGRKGPADKPTIG